MKNNILILGALPTDDFRRSLYELMTGVCLNHAKTVYSPIDTANFNGNGIERFQRAIEKIREADIIVGEQSLPSTGEGIEIGYSLGLNKPLIVVARSGSKVSELARYCPTIRGLIYYNDFEALRGGLDSLLCRVNT